MIHAFVLSSSYTGGNQGAEGETQWHTCLLHSASNQSKRHLSSPMQSCSPHTRASHNLHGKNGHSVALIPFAKFEVIYQGMLKEVLTALQPGNQSRNGMHLCAAIVWGPSQGLLKRGHFRFIPIMQTPANCFCKSWRVNSLGFVGHR